MGNETSSVKIKDRYTFYPVVSPLGYYSHHIKLFSFAFFLIDRQKNIFMTITVLFCYQTVSLLFVV